MIWFLNLHQYTVECTTFTEMIYLAISRQSIWLFGLIESVCVLESGATELVRLYSCALLCTSHGQTSLVSSSSVLPQCYLSWGVKQQIISSSRNTPAPAFTCKTERTNHPLDSWAAISPHQLVTFHRVGPVALQDISDSDVGQERMFHHFQSTVALKQSEWSI